MDKEVVLLTTKQFDLFNKLRVLVSCISKEQKSLKFFCGYCRDYYDILFHYNDDIIYFVKQFPKSYLKEILLEDDLDNFIRFYIND